MEMDGLGEERLMMEEKKRREQRAGEEILYMGGRTRLEGGGRTSDSSPSSGRRAHGGWGAPAGRPRHARPGLGPIALPTVCGRGSVGVCYRCIAHAGDATPERYAAGSRSRCKNFPSLDHSVPSCNLRTDLLQKIIWPRWAGRAAPSCCSDARPG